MKIAGITLILVGIVYFLKNVGIITAPIDWNIIWPLLVIIAGFSLKHCKPIMYGGMCKGGACEMCAGGKCCMGGDSEHKCEGPECKH